MYSVAILSYDAPIRPEPNRYVMPVFGKSRLQGEFTVIQLNRLSWRKFIKTPTPAAAALMTKMKIAPKDRLKATREIVRMIATLKLDPARTHLIANFMDAYLKLNAEELKQYERKYSAETTPEEKMTMELLPHTRYAGRMEGLQEGLQTGAENVVKRILQKRFGAVETRVTKRLDQLSADQLADMGVALLDFTSFADLESWLARQ